MISAALVEAVDVTVRYDTKFSTGQTRRERAAGFGRSSPNIAIEQCYRHLWSAYWVIRNTKSGSDQPINHMDICGYRAAGGNLILDRECDIILKMDIAYRKAASEVSSQDAELSRRYKEGAK